MPANIVNRYYLTADGEQPAFGLRVAICPRCESLTNASRDCGARERFTPAPG